MCCVPSSFSASSTRNSSGCCSPVSRIMELTWSFFNVGSLVFRAMLSVHFMARIHPCDACLKILSSCVDQIYSLEIYSVSRAVPGCPLPRVGDTGGSTEWRVSAACTVTPVTLAAAGAEPREQRPSHSSISNGGRRRGRSGAVTQGGLPVQECCGETTRLPPAELVDLIR